MQIKKQVTFVSNHDCSYVISLLMLDSVVHHFIVTFSLFIVSAVVFYVCAETML